MTMMVAYKVCPKCKKRYSWNPDVGRISCPNCSSLSLERGMKQLQNRLTRTSFSYCNFRINRL